MQGKILVYTPTSIHPEEFIIDDPPDLKLLQAHVKGNIELIPLFDTIVINNELCKCVAFCNEEGKLQDLEVNATATSMWASAMLKSGHMLAGDMLVGNVAVVIGDNELLEAM